MNFLECLSQEEYRTIRRRMIENVLATDMANHTKHLNALKTKAEFFDIKNGQNISSLISVDNFAKNYENQQIVLSNILHAADISNPAKPLKIYDFFVKQVFKEFFIQGDKEKKLNLPVSLLCDRTTTNVEKSQIGFINFIVLPTFETLYNFTPNIEEYLNNIKSNLRRYEEMTHKKK
jgi:cAMP-specific phosphodiesterase 4